MSEDTVAKDERIDRLHKELDRDAEASGYHLNPDREFAMALAEGLLVNENRFGYRSCPCRLSADDEKRDLDIICPCDYRDPDLAEWGACYCALYVSQDVLDGRRELAPIPERRQPEAERGAAAGSAAPAPGKGGVPVWRCRVCGYLCAREQPPERCPICKAQKERFELFWE